MENLDKLTKAGVPIFDLNSEHLAITNWNKSPLGPREKWSPALACLVNSCVLPLPHAAAIFWGAGLDIIHNLAWGKARGDLDGLGTSAHDTYSDAALSSLRTAIRGRTLKVASRFFLKHDNGDDSQLLLSTLLDENGNRMGVLAQYLDPLAEEYMPLSGLDELADKQPARHRHSRTLSGLDKLADEHPARRTTKESAEQQTHADKGRQAVDVKQTQLFQRFAELLPNGLAILDAGCEAIFVNDNFFKLTTNKSQNEFRAWPESIHPDDYSAVMDGYRQAFNDRQELRTEFRCAADASGEEGEWRLFLLKPLSSDPEAGYICAIIDITEIKQAQLTQEKAATDARDRKEQQERFIDMVSHEIRNPLSAVLHLAEEVKDVTREISDKYPDVQDHVSDILDAADTILLCVSHQNTLVDDILSFSKLDSMMLTLVPREVRPKWEFSRALKVFNSEFKAKQIDFHYAMDTSYDDLNMDGVVADLNRMNQVLVNLITNAIKFTAKKKGERNITVTLGASYEKPSSYPPNVIFFSEKNAAAIDRTMTSDWGTGNMVYLMVAVKDTGIGISKENQTKLFERFRQATPKTQEKYGGSGLGLFISRKLCQLHGGDIGVSSIDGKGSTFGFFFKARYSTAFKDGARPSGSRNNSDSPSTDRSTTSNGRPGYSRANSTLHGIKEQSESSPERPKPHMLSSYHGVDAEDMDKEMNESIVNPPTEEGTAADPAEHRDERYMETKGVVDKMKMEHVGDTELKLPDLSKGETRRQHSKAEGITKSQGKKNADVNKTLLLVEDNQINQKVLRRQLQAKGFEVLVANNGQEAVDAVAERGQLKADDGGDRNYFHCILMDQEMPIKSGDIATKEIRELQAQGKAGQSPILGVSANVREAQTAAMKDAGMDDVISKPFKVDDLVKRIQKLSSSESDERDDK